MTRRFPRWAPVFLFLALYAAFMVTTNQRLTILDDEGTIVTVANTPVAKTIQTFLHGTGQHEHPPLSDLFLHGWLVLTHHSFAWLRVFANLFYIAGLLVLAKCGEQAGNRRTFWAVILFGTLWPFGYFYARITGWYCFCFLIVSLLIYGYALLLRDGSVRHWAAFTLTAVMLVWTNYYGIAILLLLLADMVLIHRDFARRHVGALLSVCTIVVLSFLPLLPALLSDARSTIGPPGLPWTAAPERIAFMLFALMASVAVAPWFLPWSLPAGLAILCLFVCLLAHKPSRMAAIQFLLLIIGLAVSHHLDLKRLLFLTPWLMLATALCFSAVSRRIAQVSIAATAIAFAIGWFGITTGLHPATSNFYEPWSSVAERTASDAKSGTVIVSDSSLYFFYLNQQLGLNDLPAAGPYLGEAAYRSGGVTAFRDTYPPGSNLASMRKIIVVRGVTTGGGMNTLDSALTELRRACLSSGALNSTPDPAAGYKRLLDPTAPIAKYRVSVEKFDCSRAHP